MSSERPLVPVSAEKLYTEHRRQILDFAWPVLLCLIAGVAMVSDYFGVPYGNAPQLLQTLFVIGVIYVAAAFASERLAGARLGAWLLSASPPALVIALAVLWHFSGTLTNPGFLLLMTVPVILAGIISPKWLPHIVALGASALLPLVALYDHEEVRWFVERWGWSWPEALSAGTMAPGAFAAEYSTLAARPDVFFAAVTAALLASGLLAGAIGSLLERLTEQSRASRALAEQNRRLADNLLAEESSEVAIVSPFDGTIIAANESFAARVGQANPVGRSLFELVVFSRKEPVREALESPEPVPPDFQMVDTDGQKQLSRVRVSHLELNRERVAKLQLDEPKPDHYLSMGINELALALIVISPEDQVLAASPASRLMFPDLEVGTTAAATLEPEGLPAGWWQIAPRRRLTRKLRCDDRELTARVVRQRIYGAEGFWTFVTLTGGEKP